MYKLTIAQSVYEPYTNKEGKLVEYTRNEVIKGESDDFEMITSLINIVTAMFKNIEVTISTTNKEEK